MFTPAKTLLLGHSFGGTVAVLSASACKPDGVILIAPLAFVRKHVHEHAPILEKGMNTNGNYEFGPLELKRDFLDEIGACDPVAAFSKEAIPTALILHGENDSQILPEESQRYVTRAHACGVPCASIPVKQADHLFSTVASRLFLQKTITTWALEVTQ
jgi:acetyl esterase/lipase